MKLKPGTLLRLVHTNTLPVWPDAIGTPEWRGYLGNLRSGDKVILLKDLGEEYLVLCHQGVGYVSNAADWFQTEK